MTTTSQTISETDRERATRMAQIWGPHAEREGDTLVVRFQIPRETSRFHGGLSTAIAGLRRDATRTAVNDGQQALLDLADWMEGLQERMIRAEEQTRA